MVASDHLSDGEFEQARLPYPPRGTWEGNPGDEIWDSSFRWGGYDRPGTIVDEHDNPSAWTMERAKGFSHRSRHEFSPGDVVMPPQDRRGATNYGFSSPQHAYASQIADFTVWERTPDGREILAQSEVGDGGRFLGPNRYDVRPLTGNVSPDHNMADAYRSRVGFEVLGQLPSEEPQWRESDVPPIMRGYYRTMRDH